MANRDVLSVPDVVPGATTRLSALGPAITTAQDKDASIIYDAFM